MVIPVGGSFYQEFIAFDKINGEIVQTPISGVRYVPLTDLKKQLHEIWLITLQFIFKQFFRITSF